MRTFAMIVVCSCCWTFGAGCSHMTEGRVAKAFAESLKDHDLAKLKDQTSSDFEEKAIQGEATFEALKMVDVPEGKIRVVKVIDKKDDDDKKKVVKKRVTVEVGDKKTGLKKYWLWLKPEGSKWVVDDVYLSKKDEKANKSLGSKLAVLISLHESLAAWKAADRDRMLASATPEFSKALSDLSPEHLARFAKQLTADVAEQQLVMSQDRIGEEAAELRVARGTQGELELKFRQIDKLWKLDDIQAKSRRAGDDIASVRQVTAAMAAAHAFQEAYRSSDKQRLEKTTTPDFFGGSLAAADLSLVKLPGAADPDQKFDVRLDGAMATYVVSAGPEVLKISLERQGNEKYHQAPTYLVDDVTIFELNGSENKRLSALFTSHATLAAFNRALATHDLEALQAHTTHDFNERVWSPIRALATSVADARNPDEFNRRVWPHIHATQFPQLPFGDLRSPQPLIVQTDFKGSLTEIHVEQGETPMTYVLRDEGGRMLVDDVVVPATTRPESLKTNIEMMLPVMEFAFALEHSQMDQVRGASTADFSRIAWNHFYDKRPQFERDPLPHLAVPVTSLRINNSDKAVLTLGTNRFGAEVRLEKERGRFRIDDVILIDSSASDQKIGLKRVIRTQLSNRRQPLARRNLGDAFVSGREAQD
jgi:hypothetical protein